MHVSMEDDPLPNVTSDEVQLERVTLDEARSVVCLPCTGPGGGVVWEWWALDTSYPHRSCCGKAGSVENAKAAALKVLNLPRQARMPEHRAVVRPSSDRPLVRAGGHAPSCEARTGRQGQ